MNQAIDNELSTVFPPRYIFYRTAAALAGEIYIARCKKCKKEAKFERLKEVRPRWLAARGWIACLRAIV